MAEMTKAFHVVHIIIAPFKHIDEYVCVPRSWIYKKLSKSEKKIIVAYPNDEDPHVIRDRVQKKEKPDYNWRLYVAVHYYATGSYKDANNWIAKHTDNVVTGREIQDAALVNPYFSRTHQTSTAESQAEPTMPEERNNILRKPIPKLTIKLNSHSGDVSTGSKYPKYSIEVQDDQLTQSSRINSNAAVNVKTNSERTQPVEDKSITSVQSASTRCVDEKQPSPDRQNSTELLQPTAERTPFVPENIVVETESNLETQAVPPNTGFYHFIHQYPPKVDQATETDPVMDVNRGKGRVSELPDGSAPRVVESSFQEEESLLEERPALSQGTDSESDISTDVEDSDSDTSTENTCADRPITSRNPQMQKKLDEVQEMLNMFVTMFARMGANYNCTRDICNYLQNRIIKCVEIYELLIEKVERLNEIERLQASMTQSTVATTETAESRNSESVNKNTNICVNENTNIGVNENTNIGVKENTNIGANNETNINDPRRPTFVLPPEYDPNDSKWTLKYKQKEPGLVELLPRTNVYVSKEKLDKCKRVSKDCKMLARMLLTEVFNSKALSVCSLTGGKAKAFKSENSNIRPGLDSNAMMVLLTFVEEYGAKCGWQISDLPDIIATIRSKIHVMRAKLSQDGKD